MTKFWGFLTPKIWTILATSDLLVASYQCIAQNSASRHTILIRGLFLYFFKIVSSYSMFAWRGIRTLSSIRWKEWRIAPIPLFVRPFAISGKKRNFITSEAVEMGQLTPALQQYFKLKEQYKGCCFLAKLGIEYVLFFRVGDFYEFFFNDAITMSQVLGIALTTRGKYKGVY